MAGRKQGKLKDEHRAFIVQRLACWDSPKEAAEALRDEFGIEISPQSAEGYDPTKYAGRGLSAKWRDLFEKTRKDFQTNLENYVPEANKIVRVRQLAHSARALKGRGNHVGAADMLERIAKELGNVHTNTRQITGKDGGPVRVAYSEMTDEQLDRRLTQLMSVLGEASGGSGEGEGDDDA